MCILAMLVLSMVNGSEETGEPSRALIGRLKADGRLEVTAERDGRLALWVPTDVLEVHPIIAKVRGQHPPDVNLLRTSTEATGGSVYPICVYVETHADGTLHLYVLDGGQRLRAAREARRSHVNCLYLARWTNVEIALGDALSLNAARFEFTDEDIFSILDTRTLTTAQIAERCERSESTIERFEKVREHDWLRAAIRANAIGYVPAGRLIDSCAGNLTRLSALRTSFMAKFKEASDLADFWANEMKGKKRKWPKKARDKARISTYFKGTSWKEWEDALQDPDGIEQTPDGEYRLRFDEETSSRKAPVRIGDAADWKEFVAVFDFFGRRHDEIATEDLAMMLKRMPEVQAKIEAIYRQRVREEAAMEEAIPVSNPVVTPEPPPPPTPQKPAMKVGKRSAGKTEQD
jgi:hypothetical protein